LVNFATNLQGEHLFKEEWWTIYIDDSSNPKGAGVEIVLEGLNDVVIEKSLHFTFKMSNNQVEYGAIIVGLTLSKEVGVQKLICRTDSKLTFAHLIGEYQKKDALFL